MGVKFRWYSGESDTVPTGPGPRGRRRLWRWLAVSGLLALTFAGGVYWQSQRGLRAIRADLQRIVDRELQALRAGERDAFFELLDARYGPWLRYHTERFEQEAAWYAARPGVRAYVESMELGRDMAIASVRLRNARGAQTEPLAWYFGRLDGEWRHAPPDGEFWGSSTSISTPHISLEVQDPDREGAARVAPELEAFWGRLAQRYRVVEGAPAGPAGRTRLSVERLAIRILPFGSSGGANTIPSPQLALELWAPAERYARLEREARLAVARAVLSRILDRSQPGGKGRWLIESLALWHAGAWQPEWHAMVQSSLADGSYRDLIATQEAPSAPAPAWQLRSLPAGEENTRAVAYTLGEFLGSTLTPEQLRDLLCAVDASTSPWDAFQAVLGLDAEGLQGAWAIYLGQHYAAG